LRDQARDAGVMTPRPQRLSLQPLLQGLHEQYAPLAAQPSTPVLGTPFWHHD